MVRLLVLTRDAWPESKLSLAKFPAGKTSSRRQISAIKMPWFSSETSSLSQLDAVFTGSLIIVRTRCLFVGFGIMGHLVLEWHNTNFHGVLKCCFWGRNRDGHDVPSENVCHMSGIGLKIPEIRRMRTRTRLLKAMTILGMCDRIPDIWHTFSLGTTRPSRIRPRKKEKQRIEKCVRLCGGITRTYRRRMAGVKIVDGEIAGGENVIPETALGDENAGVSW